MKLPKKIRVREVGPREGFQVLKHVYPTHIKTGLIEILNKSGLREIEVTSFVKKDLVPQMADAEELIKAINPNKNVRYTGLYLNQAGFLRAESCRLLKNEAWISAACSNTFLKKNANTDLNKILADIPKWIKIFSDSGKELHGLMLSTAF